jgi:hypothetical protein
MFEEEDVVPSNTVTHETYISDHTFWEMVRELESQLKTQNYIIYQTKMQNVVAGLLLFG